MGVVVLLPRLMTSPLGLTIIPLRLETHPLGLIIVPLGWETHPLGLMVVPLGWETHPRRFMVVPLRVVLPLGLVNVPSELEALPLLDLTISPGLVTRWGVRLMTIFLGMMTVPLGVVSAVRGGLLCENAGRGIKELTPKTPTRPVSILSK